jgi:hypothetical protein
LFGRQKMRSRVFCNLKGCEKVAGGRSGAETTGTQATRNRTLKGCKLVMGLAPLQGADAQIASQSGGLRPPAIILQPFGLLG